MNERLMGQARCFLLSVLLYLYKQGARPINKSLTHLTSIIPVSPVYSRIRHSRSAIAITESLWRKQRWQYMEFDGDGLRPGGCPVRVRLGLRVPYPPAPASAPAIAYECMSNQHDSGLQWDTHTHIRICGTGHAHSSRHLAIY